jgi:26S proteasome regulatory subunit N9
MDPLVYLDALAASLSAEAGAADAIAEVKAFYDRRLWHEFSTALLALVGGNSHVRAVGLDIHENVVCPVRMDMSHEVYIKFLYLSAFGDAEKKQEEVAVVLDGAVAALLGAGDHQGVHTVMCIKALVLMAHGPSLDAKRLLTTVQDFVASIPVQDLQVLLLALCNRALVRQHELLCDYDEFYAASFAFAQYGAAAGVPIVPEEMAAVAYKTAIAALLAGKIYNFGRLLTYAPYAAALEASPDTVWALALCKLCNAGDVAGYEAFVAGNAALIASIDDLAKAVKSTLGRKVRLMALLHLVFHTPADQRRYTLDAIAARCAVSVAEVEPLLLTAFAQHLIEGKVDGLSQEVDVSWVHARVLERAEIATLADTIGAWRKLVRETAENVGEAAKDIPS